MIVFLMRVAGEANSGRKDQVRGGAGTAQVPAGRMEVNSQNPGHNPFVPRAAAPLLLTLRSVMTPHSPPCPRGWERGGVLSFLPWSFTSSRFLLGHLEKNCAAI